MDMMGVLFNSITLTRILGKGIEPFGFFSLTSLSYFMNTMILDIVFHDIHSFCFSKAHKYRLQCYYTEPGTMLHISLLCWFTLSFQFYLLSSINVFNNSLKQVS